MKTLKDFEFKGKKVILRSDFNVSIKEGKIKGLKGFSLSIQPESFKKGGSVSKATKSTSNGKSKGEVKKTSKYAHLSPYFIK